MEFNQAVMARRSLRAYEEGKTVEKAQIEELIRFAQMAPSWKNSQAKQILCCNVTGNAGKSKKRLPSGI